MVNGAIKGANLGYSEIPYEMRSGSELPRVSKPHSSEGKGGGFWWEKMGIEDNLSRSGGFFGGLKLKHNHDFNWFCQSKVEILACDWWCNLYLANDWWRWGRPSSKGTRVIKWQKQMGMVYNDYMITYDYYWIIMKQGWMAYTMKNYWTDDSCI